MKVLLTNDDGINSKGLEILKEEFKKDFDVYTVAPKYEVSGMSHSITLQKEIKVERLREREWSVEGTAVDCVNIAFYKILQRKIDLLVSGINPTPNLGDDVIYSGTVAAAAEGAIHGIKSFAISIATNHKKELAKLLAFYAAAKFAKKLAIFLSKKKLPPYTFLNINVPNLKEEEIKGVRVANLGKRKYKEQIKERRQGDIFYYKFENWGIINFLKKGTDVEAVYKYKMISITPLFLDLTDYNLIKELRTWKFELK